MGCLWGRYGGAFDPLSLRHGILRYGIQGPDNEKRWNTPHEWSNLGEENPFNGDPPPDNGETPPDPEPTPLPPPTSIISPPEDEPPDERVDVQISVPVSGRITVEVSEETEIPVRVTNNGNNAETFFIDAHSKRYFSGRSYSTSPIGIQKRLELDPGESETLEFDFMSDTPGRFGLIVNARERALTPDIISQIDYDDIISVVEEVNRSDLDLRLSASENVDAGQSLTYDIRVANRGPDKAFGVRVEMSFAGEAVFSENSRTGDINQCEVANSITCYFGTVDDGETERGTVAVNVPLSASGLVINSARVYLGKSGWVDPNSANDRARVTTVVDSGLESPTPTPTPTPARDVPTEPLVADAGPDRIVRPGDLVVLDGGGSSDGIHNWWYAGSAMSLPAGCDHCGDYVFDTIPLDIWNRTLRFTAPELEYGINSITLKYQLDVHVGDEVVSDEAVVCVVEDASLVDRTNAGLWYDCQSARRATPTPTPTSAPAPAPRPKPVVCLRSLGTITASVVVKGKWNSDCVSSRRPGSYYRAYTFSLANSSVISVDTYSNRELGYIELMTHDYQHIGSGNGVGGDTLSAGSYFVEAATHNQGQDAADFALSISILNPDSPPGPLTADAGPDRIVRPGDTVSLDGSGSTSGAFYDWNHSASALRLGSGCTNDDCDSYVYDEISPGSSEMNVTFTAPELKNGVELITLQYRLEVWYGSNSEFDDMVVCIVEDPSKVPTTGDLWSDCQNYDNP